MPTSLSTAQSIINDIICNVVEPKTIHEKLEQEDLTFVLDKIKHKLNKMHRRDNAVSVWSEERCNKALVGYIAFHEQDSAIRVVDDYDVKDVWLIHMLFTREYRGFCDRIFGTFIHCDLEYPQPFGHHTVDHLKNTTMGNKVVAEPMHDRHASSQERVASLNTEILLVKMMHQFPTWSLERLKKAMNEYKRFLMLVLDYGNVAPSSDVDEVWHTHILTSRKYATDCLNVLGRKFIHHAPEKKPGPKSRSAKSFQNTLVQYKAVFGETAPIEIWGGKRNRKTDRARCDLLPDHLAGCHDPAGCYGCSQTRNKKEYSYEEICGRDSDRAISLADCACKPCSHDCLLHKQGALATLVDCYEGCTPCFPGKEGNDWNKADEIQDIHCCNDVERG